MTTTRTVFLTGFVLLSSVQAADWSAFRGANGDGHSDATDVPVKWSATQNIKWKSPLPGASNGSPIISNGHVFVTSAEDEGRKRHMHCFQLATGEAAWTRTVNFDQVMPTHKTNQYGGSTPAANGEQNRRVAQFSRTCTATTSTATNSGNVNWVSFVTNGATVVRRCCMVTP